MLFLSIGLNDAIAIDVGQAVPVCGTTTLINRSQINFQSLRGQVVYVDFWASWCGPCAQSFPFMNRLHSALQDKGLHIVAINVDENTDDAEQFLKNQPAKFKVALDSDNQCAKNFDVRAMPSTYLIDRKGIVRHVHLGFRDSEADVLEEQVNQLLKEAP